jgi:hypothetical protein
MQNCLRVLVQFGPAEGGLRLLRDCTAIGLIFAATLAF